MNNQMDVYMGGALFICMCIICVIIMVEETRIRTLQTEAVYRNYAEWRVTADGETHFRWKENIEKLK